MNSEKIYVMFAKNFDEMYFVEMEKEEFEKIFYKNNFIFVKIKERKGLKKVKVFRRDWNKRKAFLRNKIIATPIKIEYEFFDDGVFLDVEINNLERFINVIKMIKEKVEKREIVNADELGDEIYYIIFGMNSKNLDFISGSVGIGVGCYVANEVKIDSNTLEKMFNKFVEFVNSYSFVENVNKLEKWFENLKKREKNKKNKKYLFFERNVYEIDDNIEIKNCLIFKIMKDYLIDNKLLKSGDIVYVPIYVNFDRIKIEGEIIEDDCGLNEVIEYKKSVENLIDYISNGKIIETNDLKVSLNKITKYIRFVCKNVRYYIDIYDFDSNCIMDINVCVNFIGNEKDYVKFVIENINKYNSLDILKKINEELEKVVLLKIM